MLKFVKLSLKNQENVWNRTHYVLVLLQSCRKYKTVYKEVVI